VSVPLHPSLPSRGARPGRYLVVAALALAAACGGSPHGDPLRVTVPRAAGLSTVADSLAARGIVSSAGRFKLYARTKGASAHLQPGVYEFRAGEGWGDILDRLVRGDVVKVRVVIPEGWTSAQIADRLAATLGGRADSLRALLVDPASARRHGLPGPTLEGYLYPATYVFPLGTPLESAVGEMVRSYRAVWTPAMRAQLAGSGMTEREVVTLASIVEREARDWTERPLIAAVYRNRLRAGMRLQADPTVLYALGGQRPRLLYKDIATVAGSPYNTYTHAGLPPGPIASPSKGSLQAALSPAAVPYLYFVAGPNGRHTFSRTLAEHNVAKRAAQAATRAAAANPRPVPAPPAAPAPPAP
jgi:UPF0755 protein